MINFIKINYKKKERNLSERIESLWSDFIGDSFLLLLIHLITLLPPHVLPHLLKGGNLLGGWSVRLGRGWEREGRSS